MSTEHDLFALIKSKVCCGFDSMASKMVVRNGRALIDAEDSNALGNQVTDSIIRLIEKRYGKDGARSAANEQQHGGDHYKQNGIEPWDYIIENDLRYCEGNVVKYVTRHREKNGLEDIEKAIHYLEKIKETYARSDRS